MGWGGGGCPHGADGEKSAINLVYDGAAWQLGIDSATWYLWCAPSRQSRKKTLKKRLIVLLLTSDTWSDPQCEWTQVLAFKSLPSEIIRILSQRHLIKAQSHIQIAPPAAGWRGSLNQKRFKKTCFWPWGVPLNCGLCEPERGWILPAGEPNRQGLCLSWLPAHLCCVPLHGATLLAHKRVCIQTGRVRRRVAGAPIGTGRVGVRRCGLCIRCEEDCCSML